MTITSPLLNEEQAAAFLTMPVEDLQAHRDTLTGPNFLMLNGEVRYLQSSLLSYLEGLQMLPTQAQLMQRALTTGNSEVRAALKAREAEGRELDAQDRIPQQSSDPYAVSMALVGQSPGMVQINTCKPIAFNNGPAAVSVAPARNGAVPQPAGR